MTAPMNQHKMVVSAMLWCGGDKQLYRLTKITGIRVKCLFMLISIFFKLLRGCDERVLPLQNN